MTQPTCPTCGADVAPGYNRKYCSAQCRSCATYQRRKNDPEAWADYLAKLRANYTPRPKRQRRVPIPCNIDGCERDTTGRGMCKMHYKRWARANGYGQSPSDGWSDTRRNNYQARRARIAGGRNGDRALLADIIERDGLDCARCGRPVDLDIPWPDRMSKSIDHRQALARGGAHTLANTQLMHLACNASKGTKAA